MVLAARALVLSLIDGWDEDAAGGSCGLLIGGIATENEHWRRNGCRPFV